ncbi:MAG: nucleotidyltransferase domain-containing protein [Desulfovibrio sp.]|nr:nucleotidyltransferase domain-containing protein [Desulfovibrio sp.]
MTDRKLKILEAARSLCARAGSRLLYLSLFGSELYGTSTGSSDTDVRGIFLPSLESLILKKDRKSLHFSTGDNTHRNSGDDIDIDLWALGYWTRDLLPAGDTGALDLLFSVSHADCVIFRDPLLDPVFENPLKFLDLANNKAYAQYSLSQAKKYGIKGSRLGAIKAVRQWLESTGAEGKLGPHIPSIVADCGHESYCFAKDVEGAPALVLCGKVHLGGTRVEEFRSRVCRDMDKYGSRAKDAERNQNIDFKALSHALRALDQMEELLLTGKIRFPLATREKLMAIKRGDVPWAELEGAILARLAEIDGLHDSLAKHAPFDADFAEKFLLSCYGSSRPAAAGEAAAAIRKELADIGAARKVRILFAAEAGSRAWGFPSMDSDYDVRFIYVHEPDWYLGAAPELERDVIEKSVHVPGIGELDMSGWELRKALKIFRAGNPQIAEWLLSPVIYVDSGPLAQLLRSGLDDGLSQGGMWHHYRGLLGSARKRMGSGNRSAKTLLYAVRPLLIMLWLERGLGVPPVRLEQLVERLVDDAALAVDIRELVERKKSALEQDNHPAGKKILEWLDKEESRLEEAGPALDWTRKKADIDAIFRTALNEAFPGARADA